MDIAEIEELGSTISNLINLKNEGIVNNVDVVILELMDKQFKLKEKKVLEKHKYEITETTITKNGKRCTRWQTKCGDKRPRCATREALIEKLYSYYFGNDNTINKGYSFKSVFTLAREEKINTERPKEKTIRDYNSSFKALISDELACKDIRKITHPELQKYIMDTVINLDLTEKRMLKLKGVLNLVFNYATNPAHKIIDINPVPKDNKCFKKHCRPSKKKPEEKAMQPEERDILRKDLWDRINKRTYDAYGYAILFASWTGLRAAEIPALKWSDITDKEIHIHAQQNDEIRNGVKTYYYNTTTKNEKGISNDGRLFPINKEIKNILEKLREEQETLGIKSEWVFAKKDGSWINTAGYTKALYTVTKKLGLSLSNNHAFRMALNSYDFITMNITVTERSRMLGHSVETNLRYYSFARKDCLKDIRAKWDAHIDSMKCSESDSKDNNVGTSGYLKILEFKAKEKSQKTANLQALS